ncbi:DHA2 family efflux MFS transporter permease subunit [Kutzneria buriramensis]|uniref:DHA2 family efflux MFS transporter permease subunit n=1 Tax=Kutzneria buriramensis TaxID=1045776 RepID=UPI001FE56D10
MLARPKIAVSVVFVLALFMSIMDTAIVNVALPSIGNEFQVSPTSVGAVSIGYLVSLAVVIPASGWLGDRLGGKRVMLGAIVLFTVASALCGLAGSFTELVGFRVLQGISGGMLMPVGMAMLFQAFPPAERMRASAILTIPTTLAPATGPLLGGVLVDALNWRWVFLVNIPFGIIALVYGLLFLRDADEPVASRFDLRGFLLSGLGFAALMYGVSAGPEVGWGDPLILATLAIGVVLLVALVITQRRTREPLLALRLFGDRLFRSMTGVMVLTMASFFGVIYLAALFLQDCLGVSPLVSGLSTFPEALGIMVGSTFAGRFVHPRLGPRWTSVCALVLAALSIGSLTLITSTAGLWPMRIILFVLGIAIAHIFVPAQATAFTNITGRDTGAASTLFNALRQLGSALGVAAITTALTLAGGQHSVPGDVYPYHVAFTIAAFIALLGALVAMTITTSRAEH